MRIALIALVLLAPLAVAEEPQATGEISHELATYHQLTSELHQLAERDRWVGVERAYLQMLDLEIELSRDDHILGATSAASTGNVADTLVRLREAHKLGESRAVIEWMYRLDTKYGWVRIHDERRRPAKLESTSTHFMPDANMAVRFAASELEDGVFEGLLPVGTYRYGRDDFEVEVRETVELEYAKK